MRKTLEETKEEFAKMIDMETHKIKYTIKDVIKELIIMIVGCMTFIVGFALLVIIMDLIFGK